MSDLLFPTDTGTLPLDTRKVITYLLHGPTIDGQRHGKLWGVLQRDERLVRSRLHDLFLELVVDHDLRIAFVRQVAIEEEIPNLLRKHTMSFKESLLMLHLRHVLAAADAKGERCLVDRPELLAHLELYAPVNTHDPVRASKQAEAAIEKLIKLTILNTLKGNDTAYEVSPVLKMIFSLEDIQGLAANYELLRTAPAPQEAAAAA